MQQPQAIIPLGSPFIELTSIESTNSYALSQIRKGRSGHGTAFFTHEQTAGKGQMGRQWHSEKDSNIALSIVIQPKPLLISQQFQLSACIAVAVRSFLASYAGNEVKIKWPNDLYWQDRKLGGILIENIIGGTQAEWQWAVAGIGLNINQTRFLPDLINPCSLKQITNKKFDTKKMAKELCVVMDSYFNRLKKDGFTELFEEYNHCLYKLNETVRLKKDTKNFEATIKGVTANGQLITESNGIEIMFDFGEISWVTFFR